MPRLEMPGQGVLIRFVVEIEKIMQGLFGHEKGQLRRALEMRKATVADVHMSSVSSISTVR